MSVSHIKPLFAARAAAANASRPAAAAPGFAGVAAGLAAGDPKTKAATAPASPPPSATADGVAAMRLALARMGAGTSASIATTAQAAPSAQTKVVDVGMQADEASGGSAGKLPPLTGRDLQDMLQLQTGSFNPSLYERLGAHYNDYVNAYGEGGYYYDPAAVTLAKMSDADVEKLKTQYASPQAWLEKHGWYANAVAGVPSNWDELTRARSV
jgi:hypothetical protein